MGKLKEADKLFDLSSERLKTKNENKESIDDAVVRMRLELYAWRSARREQAFRLLRRALSVSDPPYRDVRVVADGRHRYSIARGNKKKS